MHETLMQVPNMLFYDNMIKCGYQNDPSKVFLYSDRPFLFLDVDDGQEVLKGTSFVNFSEVDATVSLIEICLNQFKEAGESAKF